MTSCNQLKYYFFLILFYIKIAYFVREKIKLFIGIFISIKGTFPFKSESPEKMVKTSNLSCKNKTKQKKNWRQTIKTITNELECFDVRPLHCNFSSFYKQKQQELYCAFSTVSGVSDTITRRATLRLQLVIFINVLESNMQNMIWVAK